MRNLNLPANIQIMHLPQSVINLLKPVTVLDVFDDLHQQNFHTDGLFSTEIFGRVGSEERDLKFSYVDIKIEVFHPLIFQTLCQLKNLYKGILTGKAYAVWNEKINDFEASDIISGDSGYYFFMQHWKKIDFPLYDDKEDKQVADIQNVESYVKPRFKSGSKRAIRVALVNMAREKDIATTSKILVLPAGLRDIEIDETGRTKQGEVNDFYRSLLSISNSISTSSDLNTPILNVTRVSLQNTFNEIYEYFKGLLKGKNGLIQRKWGSRNVLNGTRNVITCMNTTTVELGAKNAPGINDTVYGLYQVIKGTLPITIFSLTNGWLREVFPDTSGRAYLTDPKSLKRVEVQLDVDTVDKWTTSQGLEKFVHNFGDFNRRHKYVKINGYYLGLIYKGPDNTFKIFADIDELPSHLDRKHVKPLTLIEYIYISGYKRWNKIPTFVTRHPITGNGSIYPSWCYVKTTMTAEVRFELNDTWEIDEDAKEYPAIEFPIPETKSYVECQQVHPSRLAGLGGDYDGDMTTGNFLYLEDSLNEISSYLNSVRAYLNDAGGLQASPIVEPIQRVLISITGD